MSFEQLAQRQIYRQFLPEAGADLRGQQGIAAHLEEIVIDADLADAEQFAPDLDHQPLDGVAGSAEGRRQIGALESLWRRRCGIGLQGIDGAFRP